MSEARRNGARHAPGGAARGRDGAGHARGPLARGRAGTLLLAAARLWLPVAIAVAGAVLIGLGHGSYTSAQANERSLESAAGVALLIVALMVWMISWLFRLSLRSNAERELEEAAREHYAATGRWPDED